MPCTALQAQPGGEGATPRTVPARSSRVLQHGGRPGRLRVLERAGPRTRLGRRPRLAGQAAVLRHDHAGPGRVLLPAAASLSGSELPGTASTGGPASRAAAHPTAMACLGMRSVSLANMPVSDSRPLARLMSDTCRGGCAGRGAVLPEQEPKGGRTHRHVVADRQARKVVGLAHLRRPRPSAPGGRGSSCGALRAGAWPTLCRM